MKFIRPVLSLLGITFSICLSLSSTSHAIDHGAPDTLALEASIVSSDVDGTVMRVDLFAFNDADRWGSVTSGFRWGGNLHIDSVVASPLAWSSFGNCHLQPINCLPSQGDIDSFNVYQVFRIGFSLFVGPGLDTSSSRKHLMTYWFHASSEEQSFLIDTATWSGGSVYRVMTDETHPQLLTPIWAGEIVFAPTDANDELETTIPGQFTLHQNYPNPFNPTTTISFTLPKSTPVRVDIIDLLGRTIATPLLRTLSAGEHQVTWSGQTDDGQQVSSGLYFSRVSAGETSQSRPMVLLK